MVRDSKNCQIVLTSRQLRIKNCHDTKFEISVCSKVALEESTGLTFGRNPNEKVLFSQVSEKNKKLGTLDKNGGKKYGNNGRFLQAN